MGKKATVSSSSSFLLFHTPLLHLHYLLCVLLNHLNIMGTAVAQWLTCCATNQKVAGSIPDGVIAIFH